MNLRTYNEFDAGPRETTEVRIWGSPGCGKTTFLTRQIANAAEKFGPEEVLVTSFTKAAAAELAGRKQAIPRHRIGTLHSHCYRALESPKIAEELLDEWNKDHPDRRLSGEGGDLDEAATDQHYGGEYDEILAEINSLRARLVHTDFWPARVQEFHRRWSEWKSANGLLDYTDLLETALRDIKVAPGCPRVIIGDEAQDFSLLQLTLLRQWAKHAEYLLVAGDDDQLLYGWCGCTPDAFLNPPVPAENKRFLKQSFRVPRTIHAHAVAWVERLQQREPKEYLPRDEEGDLRRLEVGTWKNPEAVLKDAERYLAAGKSVMFLTACSYMLEPLVQVLRNAGIPFHNPYRTKRGDWNPLRAGNGTSAATRLLSFLRPREEAWGEDAAHWTGSDLRAWLAPVKSDGFLARGAKAAIERLSDEAALDVAELRRLLLPEGVESLITTVAEAEIADCIRWYYDHCLESKRKPLLFPCRVAVRRGCAALRSRPQIIVGTIHSVKGGEADAVYLFPDISSSGGREWEKGGVGRDGVVRQFYVGMTRARESLIICEPFSDLAVSI